MPISPFVSATRAMIEVFMQGRLKRIKAGNVTADGTEQTLLEYTEVGRILGYVDLGEMKVGDAVIIRQYIMVKEGGPFRTYNSDPFAGVQVPPVLYIQPRESGFGVKLTLQQTAGSYRTFYHDFMREL